MIKRFVLIFAVVALAVSSAATYNVTLVQPSVVNGNALKPGDYRLQVENSKVTILNGKDAIEVPVKIENGDTKYRQTTVRYMDANGKMTISEIRFRGTTTKLVLNP
jgi:hypothetical protein